MAFLLFICFSLIISISSGADTITANQSLSGDQTIISNSQHFELGFFKAGNSSNYYIGLWYKKVSEKTIAWVANRATPVKDRFKSELKIINGNLVLLDESNSPIWSTDVNYTNSNLNSVIAILLEDGNLVLRNGSNSEENIWQSFDFPAHTLLPGSRIAYNNKTGSKQRLTSWKSDEDPAEGLFSLELDPFDREYLIKWNNTRKFWNSGSWDEKNKIFELVPEMRESYIYNFSYVTNENESYFTYSLYNPEIISRFVMDVSGQIKQLSWLDASQQWNVYWSQPRQQCEVYDYCGAFGLCRNSTLPFCNCLTGFTPRSQSDWNLNDFSGGCVRKTDLVCERTSEKFGFLPISSSKLRNYTIFTLGSSEVGSSEECERYCLNNCSCDAYSYVKYECSIWNGNLLGLSEDNGNGLTVNVKVASRDLPSEKKNKEPRFTTPSAIPKPENKSSSRGRVFAFAIAGSALILSSLCGISYCLYKRLGNRRKINQQSLEIKSNNMRRRMNELFHLDHSKEDDRQGIDVPYFELESIMAATDDFAEKNRLGQGGFGPVYKGILPGGQEIAVKRLSSLSGQGLQELKNEVILIAKLQHRNLVRLLGYCVSGDEKMLLYEFLQNRSLDLFIFDPILCTSLDWAMRFNIIMGIARGINYLHHDSRLRIIHRDLKTSNILLDEDMNPKISDFGLARIVHGRDMEAVTNRVVGTFGYMSPEYALDGLFSIKSDVFSFGVVMLEIISGKRNTGFYQSQKNISLLDYAWSLWTEDKPFELMDQIPLASCNSSEVLKCITVGLLCVQGDPDDRPTMTNVVMMLGGDIVLTLPTPKEPAFTTRREHVISSKPDTLTNNMVTITEFEGR